MKTTTDGGRFDDLLRALSKAPSVRPADIDLVGRTVGRFVVERRLGQGGMGVVYEASDPVLERKVALKVLRAGLRTGSATRARLHEEARRVAALCHPNIATIYDVGEHEGIVFLAMERASGESLRGRLAKPPALSFARTLTVLRAIASGLACAHAAGIIHRDLKPENVVTGDDGTVKIIDFGIATSSWTRGRDSDPGRSSAIPRRAGRPAGTRRYMAPEIAEGAAPSPRGDVYAFGVLAREVLSATTVRPRDRSARAALQKLVTTCTSEDPARRPRDGAALLDALEAIAAAPSVLARPSVMAAGAAALAAALGVLAARSVPERSASAPAESPSTARSSTSSSAARAERRDGAPEIETTSRPGGDETRATEARAQAESPRETAQARGGETAGGARDRRTFAERADTGASGGFGATSTAVPVTTSVDGRGRLFAMVPLDGVALPPPAPSGTIMPIGTVAGSATQAEVVADGNGGAVIHFTVRVKPGAPGSGGSASGTSHPYSPGALPTTGVAVSSATSSDPFHLSKQQDGGGGTNPAHPAQPQSEEGAHGSTVCTAAPPSSVHGSQNKDGSMRVFAHHVSGAEILVAIISPEGDISALGEGAAPCEDDDSFDFDEG